mmetsp:Transcript_7209/g.30699  ORF Transcript_7209/g.30699 Transcript_7209/m.30699 type:complete len:213 (-) Transcript_7209:496-1134(-)
MAVPAFAFHDSPGQLLGDILFREDVGQQAVDGSIVLRQQSAAAHGENVFPRHLLPVSNPRHVVFCSHLLHEQPRLLRRPIAPGHAVPHLRIVPHVSAVVGLEQRAEAAVLADQTVAAHLHDVLRPHSLPILGRADLQLSHHTIHELSHALLAIPMPSALRGPVVEAAAVLHLREGRLQRSSEGAPVHGEDPTAAVPRHVFVRHISPLRLVES